MADSLLDRLRALIDKQVLEHLDDPTTYNFNNIQKPDPIVFDLETDYKFTPPIPRTLDSVVAAAMQDWRIIFAFMDPPKGHVPRDQVADVLKLSETTYFLIQEGGVKHWALYIVDGFVDYEAPEDQKPYARPTYVYEDKASVVRFLMNTRMKSVDQIRIDVYVNGVLVEDEEQRKQLLRLG